MNGTISHCFDLISFNVLESMSYHPPPSLLSEFAALFVSFGSKRSETCARKNQTLNISLAVTARTSLNPSSLSQTPRWNSAAVYPVESNISLSCRMGVMEYPVPYSETYCRVGFPLHLLHFTSPSCVQDGFRRFDRSGYTGS
jgi:hypothetical protein